MKQDEKESWEENWLTFLNENVGRDTMHDGNFRINSINFIHSTLSNQRSEIEKNVKGMKTSIRYICPNCNSVDNYNTENGLCFECEEGLFNYEGEPIKTEEVVNKEAVLALLNKDN